MVRYAWMALSCLVAGSVSAQGGFQDTKVPGIGTVNATVGFSPSPLGDDCEITSRFPADRPMTAPFTVYVIAYRDTSHEAPLKVDLSEVRPDGSVYQQKPLQTTWWDGQHRTCNGVQFNRMPEKGTHLIRWFYNGAEIGRASVDVE